MMRNAKLYRLVSVILPIFLLNIFFTAPAPAASAAGDSVQVMARPVEGEEYRRLYDSANEAFGGDEHWQYAQIIDYSLSAGGPVELDRPVTVDVTPKLPGVTPMVVEFKDGRPRKVPAEMDENGQWSFSIGSSAMLMIVGVTEGEYAFEIEDDIAESGRIIPKLTAGNEEIDLNDMLINWYRDGARVERSALPGDGGERYNLGERGEYLNVPLDGGGKAEYRSEIEIGGEKYSAWYQAPYAGELTGGEELLAELEREGEAERPVLTVPGACLNWAVSRRVLEGREPGEAYMAIMAQRDRDKLPALLEQFRQSEGAGGEAQDVLRDGGVLIVRVDGSSEGWQRSSGVYSVPEGQYLTSFILIKEPGDGSMGSPHFSKRPPELSSGFARLEVRKTIKGVEDMDAAVEKLRFTVKSDDGSSQEVKGQDFSGAFTGSRQWEGSWYMDVPDGDGGRYTVTEDVSSAGIAGYDRTGYVSGINEKSAGSASAEVMLSGNASVSFVSEYESNRVLKLRTVTSDGKPLPGAQMSVTGGELEWAGGTDESGEAQAGKIEYGRLYTLTQPESPPGMLPLEGSVQFTISADGSVAFYDQEGQPAEYSDRYRLVSAQQPGDGEVLLTVKSLPEYRLPKTGGSTAWPAVCGAALALAGAGGGVLLRRRRRNQ